MKEDRRQSSFILRLLKTKVVHGLHTYGNCGRAFSDCLCWLVGVESSMLRSCFFYPKNDMRFSF